MTDESYELLQEAFDHCGVFFRDTTLPGNFLEKYKIGLFLREPTFCDATYKLSGFIAPHRFLIISSNARCLDVFSQKQWGLCVWTQGRIFKIIDKITNAQYTQITLLEIPEALLSLFCNSELNQLEQTFICQARTTFEECCALEPLPELNTKEWRDRLIYPIGINDVGNYFPLFDINLSQSEDERLRIAKILYHQATVYLSIGSYSEAAHLLQSAIKAQRTLTSKPTEALGLYLLTLGDLYLEIFDIKNAESALFEAFQIFNTLGHDENRILIAAILIRLGHLYQSIGALPEAERCYLHSLKIRRRVSGERSDLLVPLLSSLGALYETWGKYDDAELHLRQALEIECENKGKVTNSVLLNNLARLEQVTGKHAQAIQLFQQSLETEEINTAKYDEQRNARLLYNLAESYAALEQFDEALASITEGISIDRHMIDTVFSFASERQRMAIIRGSSSRVAQCISLILKNFTESSEALGIAANLVLERKALVADMLARQRAMVLSGRYPYLEDKIRELNDLRSQIAKIQLAGPPLSNAEEFQSEIEKYIARREELESELSNQIPEVNLERIIQSSDYQKVINAIPANTALIEYFRFRMFNFKAVRSQGESNWNSEYYIVLVFVPNSTSHLKIINLGLAEEIDLKITEFKFSITGQRDNAYCRTPEYEQDQPRDAFRLSFKEKVPKSDLGQKLYKLVFEPVVQLLENKKRLFIAPDGNLFRLPFETLPTNDERWIIDDYHISYLSSGRDLLRFNSLLLSQVSEVRSEVNKALVVAYPDYNFCKVAPEKAQQSGETTNLYFSNLPGTKEEGERIAHLLGVDAVQGQLALKSVIKAAHSPWILHLATHGFVLNYKAPKRLSPDEITEGMIIKIDRKAVALSDNGNENLILATPISLIDASQRDEFTRFSGKGLDNPLLRSGLALAGANSWLKGAELPDEAEDGILTGEDVSGLDLVNTELVVLSACETGLGEIEAGEGVLGLRRAFVLAGAKTLVMSLWKVPDKATQELMVEFYKHLLRGDSRSDALRNAQLAMKKQYPHPLYWGAFICQGNPEPLMRLL
jgi:CHAT domain-containing protein